MNHLRHIFLQEVLMEKKTAKPCKHYIQRMQNLADKDIEITFSVFKDTGRLMPSSEVDLHLDPSCTDVMKYIGGYIAESLKPNGWLAGGKKFDNIKAAEEYIYEQFVERELINS